MARKLLLADDSHTIQQVVELTFANEDIDVVTVGDGARAIEAIERDRPDIVLADVSMPGKDGYDVASFVRSGSARAGIPVVLLTGAFEPLDKARCDAIGLHEVLVKPFEPREVVGKVRELLELDLPAAPAGDAPESAAAAVESAPQAEPVEEASEEEVQTADGVEAVAPDSLAEGESELPAAEEHVMSEEVPSTEAQAERPEDPAAVADTADPAAPPAAEAAEVEAVVPPAAEATAAETEPVPPAGAGGSVLAESFVTFLAVEQGAAPPALRSADSADSGAEAPLLPEAVMDALADRVVERLTDTVLRDTVTEVVSRIAERLAREEITRIPPGSE